MSPTKELYNTLFISNITEEQLLQFPSSYVDWKSDKLAVAGNDYYLLFYKDVNDDTQIYYISIDKPKIGIADIQGNLLKVDSNGDYYVIFEWIETN